MGEDDGRPDMINRDPNNINDGLQVKFEDVFGEPEGSHSPDCAWRCGYKCYEGSRGCCYKCLTVLCTWLIGLCWGCEFACLTFNYIWSWTPSLKMTKMVYGVYQRFWETYINCCLAPVCSACGMCFSNIRVTQA